MPISALGAEEEKNATGLLNDQIIWMNDHCDDPRATPSCASFIFRKCQSVLIALYFVAVNGTENVAGLFKE